MTILEPVEKVEIIRFV